MPPGVTGLLQAPDDKPGEEQFITLLQTGQLRLEQIVSRGQASPTGFWYDQPTPEWVALLAGSATLEFDDGRLPLAAGDALLIPAHCRHRVAECSQDAIWLALHFQP
ncbi:MULTISPECIES: cupin domain-containing protein [unclassified Pseudomonas]|uniref:cupin domain-containing protein n=1 Tax=unclassified Pseudomonas TaxID=196821 RepID=UPI00244D1AE6|nr:MULTISPECIES: cupin domain-containing protein [unclassified Pseudomonas]MDG9923543.1 cupin domain-containing protein [Pseudomonas sp. GD04045]MDH0036305.1 cupin domain-containing protein [Pseudomonas sp. GD04019]